MNLSKSVNKMIASLFTLFVVGMLVISGSVQGFSLNLEAKDTSIEKGDTIILTVNLAVESDENLPVEEFRITLSGPQEIVCIFDTNGVPLTQCSGITIQRLSSSEFGYGYDPNFGYNYGFAPGKLSYQVRINTAGYKTGTYSTEIKTKINAETFTSVGDKIVIRSRSSFRTDDGVCTAEWSCDDWSRCINGQQIRTCSRRLNYCELEQKPAEIRLCTSDSSIEEQNVKLVLGERETFPEVTEQSSVPKLNFSPGLDVIMILLLINCIITTINSIIRVQQLRNYERRRRFRRNNQPVAAVK